MFVFIVGHNQGLHAHRYLCKKIAHISSWNVISGFHSLIEKGQVKPEQLVIEKVVLG